MPQTLTSGFVSPTHLAGGACTPSSNSSSSPTTCVSSYPAATWSPTIGARQGPWKTYGLHPHTHRPSRAC